MRNPRNPRTVIIDYTFNDIDFTITGKVYPYYPAKTYDPDNSHPAEGGEIEILAIELADENIINSSYDFQIKTIERIFDTTIEQDKKLRDSIYDQLLEEAGNAEDCDRSDWADRKREELRGY
jgi:hypothetical protein